MPQISFQETGDLRKSPIGMPVESRNHRTVASSKEENEKKKKKGKTKICIPATGQETKLLPEDFDRQQKSGNFLLGLIQDRDKLTHSKQNMNCYYLNYYQKHTILT